MLPMAGLLRGNLYLRWGEVLKSGLGFSLCGGVGGTHLVKEAILADELLTGLGVDGDGEPHVCYQELVGEQGRPQRRPGLLLLRGPQGPQHALPSPLGRGDAKSLGGG